MRPDFVFSDTRNSPSFFFTTPARNPRTEWSCYPVVFEIAVIVAPSFARSRLSTRSCLVVPRFERDALGAPVFVFDLRRFAGFVRGLGLLLGAMWTSEVGDTISRTTSTPPRRAARGVRSGGAHPPPLLTSTLHSQQESSETRAILLLIEVRRTSARGDQIDMNEAELVTRVQQAARRRRTATSKTCELTCLSSRE